MKDIPGIKKPELQALPQIKDRITFLYLEHCVINRTDGAITIADIRGIVHVPAASISVLLLGPGSNVTHRAMELLGDAGTTVIWIGERGVRYYAHGRPLTHSARLLIRQAELVSNVRSRVAVARQMYQMRFPNEDVSNYTMQQLRGHEGARVRAIYRKYSKETGVPWNRREFDLERTGKADTVNVALSMANYCLYGIIHAVIVAMGCSPGLGFVHTGHERSFVFDIADLYKAQITIPIAFIMAKKDPEDLEGETRRAVRNALVQYKILEQATRDIKMLLQDSEFDETDFQIDELFLWDDKTGVVEACKGYGKYEDEDATDDSIARDIQTLDEINATEVSNGRIIEDTPAASRKTAVYEDDFFAELAFADEETDGEFDTSFNPEEFEDMTDDGKDDALDAFDRDDEEF